VTYFYNLLLLHGSRYLEAHGTTEPDVRLPEYLSYHAYILRLVHHDLKVVHKLNNYFRIYPTNCVVKHACNMIKYTITNKIFKHIHYLSRMIFVNDAKIVQALKM